MALSITAKVADPALVGMPWNLPLEQWPDSVVAAIPKGISRHLVRFAVLGDPHRVVAVKETTSEMAHREYELLRRLRQLDVPCVKPVAVVDGRTDTSGVPLPAVLVTRHLRFSLPYRAVFSQTLRPETATRLVDALALLLVRVHLVGLFWGDVSLSNTLFRRDAGAFAAYLVDAETGELRAEGLSEGQREHDLEIARVNIAGELLDLEAGGYLNGGLDPVEVALSLVRKYRELWIELTAAEEFASADQWRISQRVERLNQLGFDIEELEIQADDAGDRVRIQPKVVDAGHHQRRLMRLTGLDVEENQARRMLNDLDEYWARNRPGYAEERAAHEWLNQVFEPLVAAIPPEYRGKLEPAEVFHQILEHRWYLSEREGRAAPLGQALTSYIYEVLPNRRDEAQLFNPPTGALTSAIRTQSASPSPSQSPEPEPEPDAEVDWRDLI